MKASKFFAILIAAAVLLTPASALARTNFSFSLNLFDCLPICAPRPVFVAPPPPVYYCPPPVVYYPQQRTYVKEYHYYHQCPPPVVEEVPPPAPYYPGPYCR